MKLSKQICAATMAGMMAVSMAACGGGSGSTAASGNEGGNTAAPAVGETLGHALTYDTAAPVNNGEKIELTLWTDPEPEPYYQELAEKYHAVHQNVTINVVSQPWSDYWTPATAPTCTVPTPATSPTCRSTAMSCPPIPSRSIRWPRTSPSMMLRCMTASCTPFLWA